MSMFNRLASLVFPLSHIVITLIFMSSLWCIDLVRELLRELNCLCIFLL